MIRPVAACICYPLSIVTVLLISSTVPPAQAVTSNPVVDITFQTSAQYYEPPVAVVPTGTPIRWVNTTASVHSVRHDACTDMAPCPFQSIAIPPDSSFLVAPLPAGRYGYHCELHPVMRGTLLVIDLTSAHIEEETHDR